MDKLATAHQGTHSIPAVDQRPSVAQRSASTNTTTTSNSTVVQAEDAAVAEEDTPISVPDNGEHSEGGNLKMIVQLVKKCLGVKDIAAMYVHLCYH